MELVQVSAIKLLDEGIYFYFFVSSFSQIVLFGDLLSFWNNREVWCSKTLIDGEREGGRKERVLNPQESN